MSDKSCKKGEFVKYKLALKDALNVTSGKWKLIIVACLIERKQRYSEIQRAIGTITPRMLSKELKELEINGVIKRSIIDSTPVIIEYELTESGKLLIDVIYKLVEWGIEHRKLNSLQNQE